MYHSSEHCAYDLPIHRASRLTLHQSVHRPHIMSVHRSSRLTLHQSVHPYNPSVHRASRLTLHQSVHRPYNPSVHRALRLLLHPSVHRLFHPSFPTATNVRNSWMDSPVLIMGIKNPSESTVKFPHDITLTQQQAKFPEKTPYTTNREKYMGNFLLTRIRVKFMVINLRNYVLGVFHVALRTMRCVHGSINKILMEWDPGPTYDVQNLWDPGGSNYSSRSSVPTNLDRLGKPTSYLDYIYLPGLSPLPFLVALKPHLASSNHLEELDRMGSLRYLPRLA